MTNPAQLRGRSGFTLVEVLVALVIVAVVLSAGLRAAATLTDSAQRLADVTAAQWCADNALIGLKLDHQFPGVGTAEFTCRELGRDYLGKLVTSATFNPNFRRVDAAVADDAGRPLLVVSTVVGRY
jgi:general secretion pathway protein I